MNQFVINLTTEELEALSNLTDIVINDSDDLEYCIRAIIESLG